MRYTQGLFHKISKQLLGGSQLYISHLLRGFSEWKKEFYSKRKRFLIKGENWKTVPTKYMTMLLVDSVRTGQVEEQRRVTEEVRNFHILEAGKL